jgi:hypothetical protein
MKPSGRNLQQVLDLTLSLIIYIYLFTFSYVNMIWVKIDERPGKSYSKWGFRI